VARRGKDLAPWHLGPGTSKHNSNGDGRSFLLEVPPCSKGLFTYAAVPKRHCEGPLAGERATLEGLASRGMARETLLWRARYSNSACDRNPTWRKDKDLMAFLSSL
jgi:hypothetical protein